MHYPLHCFLAFISIWWYPTCHQPFKVMAETDSFHGNYGFVSQNSFSESWGCGLYVSLPSIQTIFISEIFVDLNSFVFSTGSTTEYSCTDVLVLAAPIIDFRMEGSPHSVLRSLWLRNFPEGSMCLSSTSTPTTFRFKGFELQLS